MNQKKKKTRKKKYERCLQLVTNITRENEHEASNALGGKELGGRGRDGESGSGGTRKEKMYYKLDDLGWGKGGCMYGRSDGRTDRRMDGRMNRFPLCSTGLSPLRS